MLFDPKAGRGIAQTVDRYALSILRIAAALLFFEHGTSRLFGFPSPLPAPPLLSLYWFAGAIEFVGGAIDGGPVHAAGGAHRVGRDGLRLFLRHAPHDFFPILNRGDGAILYCFVFFYIAVAGAGAWGLDALLARRRA